MIAVHNSLIAPARDCNNPSIEKKSQILAARDTEVAVVDRMKLVDAWTEVHTSPPNQKHFSSKGFAYAYAFHDSAPEQDRLLRRKDRIPVSQSLRRHLSKVFATYLSKFDHKAVVVACEPLVFHAVCPHTHCGASTLDDEGLVESGYQQLSSLQHRPTDNWEQVHTIFREATRAHKEEDKAMEAPQILPHLLSSDATNVPPQAWNFLATQGIMPDTHAQVSQKSTAICKHHNHHNQIYIPSEYSENKTVMANNKHKYTLKAYLRRIYGDE